MDLCIVIARLECNGRLPEQYAVSQTSILDNFEQK